MSLYSNLTIFQHSGLINNPYPLNLILFHSNSLDFKTVWPIFQLHWYCFIVKLPNYRNNKHRCRCSLYLYIQSETLRCLWFCLGNSYKIFAEYFMFNFEIGPLKRLLLRTLNRQINNRIKLTGAILVNRISKLLQNRRGNRVCTI